MAEYTRTHSIPLDILDDLASRFVINLPFHIKDDLTRIFFQVSSCVSVIHLDFDLGFVFRLNLLTGSSWTSMSMALLTRSERSSWQAAPSESLPSTSLGEFDLGSRMNCIIFISSDRHLSFLQPLIDDLDELFAEWKEYKIKVPTMGAIMLNEDLSHVLLVQSFYSKTSWGFPKVGINNP